MRLQYSDTGVDVVRRAQCQSAQLGHNYVGTEHLLLSLAEGDSHDAALKSVFERLDLSYDAILTGVLSVVGRGVHPAKTHRPYAIMLQRVFDNTQVEAARLGAGLVWPAHLLLALVPPQRFNDQADPNFAGWILSDLGLDFENARPTIIAEILREQRPSYCLSAMTED